MERPLQNHLSISLTKGTLNWSPSPKLSNTKTRNLVGRLPPGKEEGHT